MLEQKKKKKKKIHLYGFSETHTNSTVTNSELDVSVYKIERKDRTNGVHGEALCYIREDINYQRRDDLEVDGLEVIWIEVFIPNSRSLLIFTIYKPRDNSKYIDKNFDQKFDVMLSTSNIEYKEKNIPVSKTERSLHCKRCYQN